MSAEIRRMRARVIAAHLMNRIDTDELGPRDGVSVGGCRTDVPPAPKSEFQAGVTALEVVAWFAAGAMAVLVLTPDLGGLIWSLVK